MAIGTSILGSPVNLTASGVVAGGTAMARTYKDPLMAQSTQAENTSIEGAMLGFFVNTTSSGIIKFSSNNGGAAGTDFTGQITPAAGNWYPLPIVNPGGIFMTLVSGSINVTIAVVK